MIFDRNWKELTGEQLKEKITNKKIAIFGASQRNGDIVNLISNENISCIYDNDQSKWGNSVDGIEIKAPQKTAGEIIVTVLEDYRNLIPQLSVLGFQDIYYFMRDDVYNNFYKAYIEFFRKKETDFLLDKKQNNFKYIHICIDDKFFLPIVNIVENGFVMQEHAFVIYNLNTANIHNKYGTWQKYLELSKKYQNIVLIEDGCVIPNLMNEEDELERTISYIKESEKIIFHGEWMDEKIRTYFCREELFLEVKKKGMWIVWSGNVGKNECNKIFIETLLKHCKVIVCRKIGEAYSDLCDAVDMPKHFLYDRGATYSWIIDKPKKKVASRNVLLGQSCYPYNKNIETLQLLEKYKDEIDVFCIAGYGENGYIEKVQQEGKRIFGERFHLVDKFMPYTEYVDFLNIMDVAVYGMEIAGSYDTLRILFWLGKKVYLKKDSPLDLMTRDDGFHVFDYYQIQQTSVDDFFECKVVEENYLLSCEEFDKPKIIDRWRGLFELDMNNLELT